MKLLVMAASNSRHSINRRLAESTAALIEGEVDLVTVEDFDLPLYSADREAESGIPALARRFHSRIAAADALLISFAEHNGSYTAAYKNLFDWASRINTRVYQDKPALLLSTSPGKMGGANVLGAALKSAPHFGMNVVASLSLPSFKENFDATRGQIKAGPWLDKLRESVAHLEAELEGVQ